MTAYKVEELLALRDSASESAVSFIERLGDEDVIKEHVLRPSASAGAIDNQIGNSRVRPSTLQQPIAAGGNFKRPSPSPSVKRGKVERLIKEHGSPPGMRVTAGGRVVPSDLPPLSSPRFLLNGKGPHSNRATSAPQLTPGIFPPAGYPFAGFGNMLCLNHDGQVCQMINGIPLPLPVVDGAGGFYGAPGSGFVGASDSQAAAPFANVHSAPALSGVANQASIQTTGLPPVPSLGPSRHLAQDPSLDTATRIKLLDQEYSKLNEQMRDLERAEVIQSDYMGAAWRQDVVKQKRTFVTVLDGIRKLKKGLETGTLLEALTSTASVRDQRQPSPIPPITPLPGQVVSPQFAMPGQNAFIPYPVQHPSFGDLSGYYQSLGLQQAFNTAFPGQIPGFHPAMFNGGVAPAPANTDLDTVQPQPAAPDAGSQSPRAPNSPRKSNVTRRSHAVEIKDPRDSAKKPTSQASKGALNPASPTYEPTPRLKTPEAQSPGTFVPPSPSPIPSPVRHAAVEAKHSWLFEENNITAQSMTTTNTIRHKSSNLSAQTSDFFPVNTHEYSSKFHDRSTRIDSPHKSTSVENQPITPDRRYNHYGSPSDGGYHPVAPPVSPVDAHSLASIREKITINRSSISDAQALANNWNPTSHSHDMDHSSLRQGQSTPAKPNNSSVNLKTSDPRVAKTLYAAGYHSGLRRASIPDGADNDWISGYLEGVKDSQRLVEPSSGSTIQSKATDPMHHSVHSLESRQSTAITVPESSPRSFGPAAGAMSHHNAPGQQSPFAPTFNHPPSDAGYVTRPGASIWSPTKVEAHYKQSLNTYSTEGSRASEATTRSVSVYRHSAMSQSGDHRASNHVANSSPVAVKFDAMKGMQQGHSQPDLGVMRSLSGNIAGPRVTPLSMQRHFPPIKVPGTMDPSFLARLGPRKGHVHDSQQDGALDDLAELHDHNGSPSKGSPAKSPKPSPKKSDSPAKAKLERFANMMTSKDARSSKIKEGREEKGAEDPANMSKPEKQKWRENWRKKFSDLKAKEEKEIEEYQAENATSDS